MKNTISGGKKKYTKGINGRLDETADQISVLEDKVAESTQSEQQKRMKKIARIV